MTVSYDKLLKVAVSRSISRHQLLKLFTQLDAATPISEGEFVGLLENHENHSYLVYLSIKSSNYIEILWSAVCKSPVTTQLKVLKVFQEFSHEINSALVPELLPSLVKFIDHSIDSTSTSKELLFNQIIFTLDKLVNNFNVKENDLFKNTVTKLVNHLFNNGFVKQFEYCNEKFKSLKFEHHSVNKVHSVKLNNILINYKSKNYHFYEQFKVFFWLNSLFSRWRIPSNEHLLEALTGMFISPTQPLNALSSVITVQQCEKIIYTGFYGNYLNTKLEQPPYMKFCWYNFLLTRVPKIIALTKLDSIGVEEVLIRVFGELHDISDSSLMQVFIKSLMFNKVLSIKSFSKIFPMETKVTQQTLIHDLSSYNSSDNFHEKLNEMLIGINCEFISLEESKLVGYLNDLADKFDFSMDRQADFGNLIKNIIEDFIADSSFDKLSRLLLIFLNNDKLFSLVLFNYPGGCENLLGSLATSVDNNESFKLNDDNENSFQDFYSYFGTILLAITHLVEHFKVNDLKFKLKDSFTFNYINNVNTNLGVGLSPDVTNRKPSDEIIIENYNNLLNDWINSLFDDGGVGLSDDLIKSIEIKQIYQLLPLIYQQAVIATIDGQINPKILSTGLEYLTQNFLLPCNLSIVNWVLDRISTKGKNTENYLSVLSEIIRLIKSVKNESNNEVVLLSQFILKRLSSNVTKRFELLALNTEGTKDIISSLADFAPPPVSNTTTTINPKSTGLFKEFKSNLIRLFNNSSDTDYSFLRAGLQCQKPILNSLITEIEQLQKTNNESLKYFIDFVGFSILLKSIPSENSKKYWLEKLEKKSSTDVLITQPTDRKFELSMDYHYSTIFNTESREDDDEADELFTDSSKPNNSYSFYFNELRQKNPDLVILTKLVGKYGYLEESNPLGKTLHLIHDKLLVDLKAYIPC